MPLNLNLTFILLFLLLAQVLSAQTTLTTGLSHPESLTSDGKFLYVSDIGSEMAPDAKDGDGAIRKLSLDGKILDENFSKTKLNAPKGSGIIKNTLYVTDVNRVVGIDLQTGKQVQEIKFKSSQATFLNDLAVKDNQTIFVTETGLNKIFQITLAEKPAILEISSDEIVGPNGIYYDKKSNRLYSASLGRTDVSIGIGELGYFTFEGDRPTYTKLIGINGYFDGLGMADENTLLVSDWVSLGERKGIIKKINIKERSVEFLPISPVFGPADFYLDSKNRKIIIPEMVEGKLLQISLGD